MSRTTKSTSKKSTSNVKYVLIDTHVVVDALINREPFVHEAREIFRQIEFGEVRASVCATTLTTVDYLSAKFLGAAKSRELIGFVLSLCEVAEVNKKILAAALIAPMADFEDAVIAESAKASGLPTLITRNGKDFKGCGLQVYSPSQWLAI